MNRDMVKAKGLCLEIYRAITLPAEGDSYRLFHESAMLAVLIYDALGDHVESEGYKVLLPASYKSIIASLC